MDKQTIINKAYDHMKAQGRAGVDQYGHCMFRTPDGLSCGVGALCTDEEAEVLNKAETLRNVADVYQADHIPEWVWPNLPLLMGIQDAHDLAYKAYGESHRQFTECVLRELRDLAKNHRLLDPARDREVTHA